MKGMSKELNGIKIYICYPQKKEPLYLKIAVQLY